MGRTPPTNSESSVESILKERVERLRNGVEALTRELLEPIPPEEFSLASGSAFSGTFAREGPTPHLLGDAVRGLTSSEDQISLLDRLLEGAARCVSRVCLFIVRGDRAHGWSSVGLPEVEEGDPAKGLVVSLEEDTILRDAAETGEATFREASEGGTDFLPPLRPGDRVPQRTLAVPMLIRDKVAAILYADDGGDGRPEGDYVSVEILACVAGLAANLLALRSHPESVEMEARAEVEVHVPAPEEGGGLQAGPDLFDSEGIDGELLLEDATGSGPEGAADLSAEEEHLHEDARRFARLLVSELLLYNEDRVILGRKHRDIYRRLKEDIDRSRQAYEQRVSSAVSGKADYFKQELIRTLAGGDPTALGPDRA